MQRAALARRKSTDKRRTRRPLPTRTAPARLGMAVLLALALAISVLLSCWTSASAAAGWQPVALPTSASVTCLTTGARLSVVYVCTAGDGILRIKSHAPSVLSSTGIPSGATVRVVTPALDNAQDVLAGTSGGIYRSTDGGSAFSAASSGLPTGASITALAFGANGSSVLAGTAANGIYRSTDGGVQWSADDSGLTGTPKVNSLTYDPHAHIFVAALAGAPLVSSNTSATHWSSAGNGLPPGSVSAVTTLASGGVNANGATLYATTTHGVFDSQDDGQSWTSLLDASRAGTNATLAPDPAHAGTLYLGTTQTVLVSQDGGNHWHLVAHGIAGIVSALAPLPNGSNTTVYAVGSNGLFSYQARNTPNISNAVGEGIIAVIFLGFCYWIWRRTRRILNLSGSPASRTERGTSQNTSQNTSQHRYKFTRDERPSLRRTSPSRQSTPPPAPSPAVPTHPHTPQTRARMGGHDGPPRTPQTDAPTAPPSNSAADEPPDTRAR